MLLATLVVRAVFPSPLVTISTVARDFVSRQDRTTAVTVCPDTQEPIVMKYCFRVTHLLVRTVARAWK